MVEEKVVSIEDRIPKLREARRKKSNRRLIFYICLFFSLISIVVYLQSPLSYVNQIKVVGLDYLNVDDVISYSELTTSTNLWSFKITKIEEKIEKMSHIKTATVKREFPNHVLIEVEEFQKIGYINNGDSIQPILENGTILNSFPLSDYHGDAPLLYQFSDDEYLQLLIEQMAQLPEAIADHISEIYWEPTESNPYLVRLNMNDGFNVVVSIRQFSNQMPSYPSIVSQLEGTTGTIEMGSGGAIFYDENNATNQNNETEEDEQQSDVVNEEEVTNDESEG